MKELSRLVAVGLFVSARLAIAQTAAPLGSAPAGSSVIDPSSTSTPAASSASAVPLSSASLESNECLPPCRSNYVCIKGQCVSACNPACGSNEMCSGGECIARPAASPVPSAMPSVATPASVAEATPEPVGDGRRAKHRHRFSAPYTHDGLYLRLGIGAGFLNGSISTGSGLDISGTPLQLEFALGGNVSRGLVVGGGVFASISGGPTYTVMPHDNTFNVDGGRLATVVLGPFMDWYPKPQNGFHVQVGLGPSFVSASERNPQITCEGECQPVGSYSGIGLGLVAGIGYEAWASTQMSLGGLIRFMYVLSKYSPDRAPDATLREFVPGVLLTLTIH